MTRKKAFYEIKPKHVLLQKPKALFKVRKLTLVQSTLPKAWY